jgi:hypothetical protein
MIPILSQMTAHSKALAANHGGKELPISAIVFSFSTGSFKEDEQETDAGAG